ncbi:class I SAM-dependent methyltransferase [Endozoicomonas acroporae]|uniref:class I SAM-dependent methyltransferase n=1 Tax=Endozoicomonas acroporae TaxID=1701104 RepID=UPI001FD1F9A3|nr:class I SAM-dependent methyltransferase [Endozoicomonas acroporae]
MDIHSETNLASSTCYPWRKSVQLTMTITSEFYQKNAMQFYNSTVGVDAQELYKFFLPLIPDGGHILDAGCGSGRDARAFIDRGYKVTAFDASGTLAAMASKLTGLAVETCLFDEFQTERQFDGVWACASLLHVPYVELAATINHLAGFLVSNGCLYCSFKYGQGEVLRDGRLFTYMDEALLQDLLKPTDLWVLTSWTTHDLRPEKAIEQWLNVILGLKA